MGERWWILRKWKWSINLGILWRHGKNVMGRYVYRPFPSSKTLSFKTKLSAKPFLWKKLCLHENEKNHFHVNGFTFSLVLKQRLGATRKSPPLSGHLRGAGKYKIISGFPIILSCNLCSVQRFRLKSTHA